MNYNGRFLMYTDPETGDEVELRPAYGCADYAYVSRDGKILCRLKYNQLIRLSNETIVNGYIVNSVYLPKKDKNAPVGRHRLVAFAWLGEPERDDLQVDHIDRDRLNNDADNLRWVTQEENLRNRDFTACGTMSNIEVVSYIKDVEKKMDELIELVKRVLRSKGLSPET